MSFQIQQLVAPQPATVRSQSTRLSYDRVHKRVCFFMGRSVFVEPLDGGKGAAIQCTRHNVPVTAASFAPSGNYVASGDEAGNVKIWDTSGSGPLDDVKLKSEFQVLSGPIRAIAWDGDGQRLIAVGGGKDKFGHCFTWDSGNSVGEIAGHSDEILDVDIKPQRPYRAATASVDKSVVFFAGPPFKFSKSYRENHANIVRSVKFSPDGKYFVSAGADKKVVVYDGKTGDVVKVVDNAHGMGIFGVDWYADSSKFVTCSADATVKVWDSDSFELAESYVVAGEGIGKQLVGVAATEGGVLALSLNGDFNFFESNGEQKVIKGHQSAISAALVHENVLYTGGTDGQLYAWAIENEKIQPQPKSLGDDKSRHTNYVVDVLALGEFVVSAGWDDILKVWKDGELVGETKLDAQPKRLVQVDSGVGVLFETAMATYLVYGGKPTVQKSSKLQYESNDVDYITDKLLTTNLNENKIEQLDTQLNAATSAFSAIRAAPSLIRVSPDKKYIALGDSSGKYVVYNSADNSVKTSRWVFHTSRVLDAKWSPDSKFLLSGGLDATLLIYSIDKMSKVTKHPLAHQTGISRVEWLTYDFGGSGSAVVVTTGLDGVIKTWKVDLSAYR